MNNFNEKAIKRMQREVAEGLEDRMRIKEEKKAALAKAKEERNEFFETKEIVDAGATFSNDDKERIGRHVRGRQTSTDYGGPRGTKSKFKGLKLVMN